MPLLILNNFFGSFLEFLVPVNPPSPKLDARFLPSGFWTPDFGSFLSFRELPVSASSEARGDLCLPPSAFRLPPSAFRLPPSAFRLPPSAFCFPLSDSRLRHCGLSIVVILPQTVNQVAD